MGRYSEKEYDLSRTSRARRAPTLVYHSHGLNLPRKLVPMRSLKLRRAVDRGLAPKCERWDVDHMYNVFSRQVSILRSMTGNRNVAHHLTVSDFGGTARHTLLHESETGLVFRVQNRAVVKMRNPALDECREWDSVTEAEQRILNEAAIGLFALNKLECPNFVRVLGCQPVTRRRNGVECLTGRRLDRLPAHYALLADFGEQKTLSKWLEDEADSPTLRQDLDAIIAQIVLALLTAHQAFEFSHNDLHCANVIVQRLPSPRTLLYYVGKEGPYFVATRYLAKMIDYGLSSARVDTRDVQTKRAEWFRTNTVEGPFSSDGSTVFLGQFRPDILCVSGRSNHVYDVVRLLSCILDTSVEDRGDEAYRCPVFLTAARWFEPLAGGSAWRMARRDAWLDWIVDKASVVPAEGEINSLELLSLFTKGRKPVVSTYHEEWMPKILRYKDLGVDGMVR